METFDTVSILDHVDGVITPNDNWNSLFNNARELSDRYALTLGHHVASLSVASQGFLGLTQIQETFIDAVEPPMKRSEKRSFRAGFRRVWELESALATTEYAARTAHEEGVTI